MASSSSSSSGEGPSTSGSGGGRRAQYWDFVHAVVIYKEDNDQVLQKLLTAVMNLDIVAAKSKSLSTRLDSIP